MVTVQCHYEILGVDRNADASTIKKAHRKLALRLHPDKNTDNHQDAAIAAAVAEQFRLVQEAYECLSDPVERRWYDEHRDAILKGWSANNGTGDGTAMIDILFDVTPFMHPSCYVGYQEDSQDSFYAVYRRVFAAVYDGEQQQQQDEFDPDQDVNEQNGLQRHFGTPNTPWEQVSYFYQVWESFASRLNFAWADSYDVTEAENRRIRRAIEDENRKARRAARKARNEEIQALVRFVKRRDPRVRERRKQMEEEKLQREKELKKETARRKKEAIEAREQWRQEAEESLAALEEEDRAAGRVRLADLEDDYDYGGKKGKRGKKKKGRDKKQEETEKVNNIGADTTVDAEEDSDSNHPYDAAGGEAASAPPDTEGNELGAQETSSQPDTSEKESSGEESEEPDVWRCECCRKDFKSEGQMENHMRSKKHKEVYKKYLAKLEKLEQQLLDEIIDE